MPPLGKEPGALPACSAATTLPDKILHLVNRGHEITALNIQNICPQISPVLEINLFFGVL
jgi:hypothetical protein